MLKNLLIAAVVLAILGGGAWYFFGKKSTQTNVVTSIKDSLSKSVSLECDYTDEQGRKTKSYIKNGAIRSDFTSEDVQESGSVILNDKKLYVWTNKKQGFVSEIPEAATTTEEAVKDQGLSQRDGLMADLEKYKQQCKPAVVSDSLFTPPADVEFTDYSQLMNPQQ